MPRIRALFGHLRRMAAPYAVLLVALALSFLAYAYVRQNVESAMRDRFDETTQAAQGALDRRVDSHLDAMRGARALFEASSSVTVEEWSGYASGVELAERYDGIQVLGYAKRVEPSEKDAFVEELSRTFGDEDLRQPPLQPEGERSVYFPMTYVEPLDKANRMLLGYDFYTRPRHREAMDRASYTGEPEATSKVPVLTQAPSGHKADLAYVLGFVVYLPIYREGEPIDTTDQRRRALDGFVVGSLEVEELLQGTFGKPFDPAIDFELYEEEGMSRGNLLYDDDAVHRAGEDRSASNASFDEVLGGLNDTSVVEPAVDRSVLSGLGRIDVAGHEYGLYFQALPEFEDANESNLPLFVLLSGIAVSLLLFGVTWMLSRSRARAERVSQSLEATNRELEVANKELEAFSYSVSHDLRAPLRSIAGFSQILLEDYSDELDDEGKDYLNRVRAASQRMGDLINDLLTLSRVTRTALRRATVDLSAVARDVVAEFRKLEPERRARVEIEEGLATNGDARLLKVALENLIGNAWKFTGKETEAKIKFGLDKKLSKEGRVPVYYVRDDGVGFDMAYADKLFDAFQRLHGANEFEGTGVGLATVQRVVRRHGGRIWAEGEVGNGATFYFTLQPGLRQGPVVPREEAGIRRPLPEVPIARSRSAKSEAESEPGTEAGRTTGSAGSG